ncbi:MAG: 2-hydroxyacid dehydrogenase [Thermoplasmata archaeon]
MKVYVSFPLDEEFRQMGEEILGKGKIIFTPEEDAAAALVRDNSFPRYNGLKFVQSITAGTDQLDINSIPRDVTVASNAGAYSIPVAEHCFALILERAKKISRFSSRTRAGFFEPEGTKALYGKTIGIIGYGGIGSRVAHIAKSFGMRVVAIGRGHKDQNADVFLGLESLDSLLSESDYVVISIPLTSITSGLIGKRELERLREGCMIVNVARPEIVNMEDMLEFLDRRRDVSYLTDVWWGEPELRDTNRENVVVTPHVAGGLSKEFMRIAFGEAFLNIKRFLDGETPRNIVRREESVYFQRKKLGV